MQQKTIVYLMKVFKKLEHAQKFIRGELYANPLSYFKKLEDGEAGRGDPHEAVSQWLQPEKVIIKYGDITVDPSDLAAPVSIQMTKHDSLNVFCMYAGQVTAAQDIEDFKEQLKISEECFGLGKHAVMITNVQEFLDRVKRSVKEQNLKAKGQLVEYYDPNEFHGSFDDSDVVFRKRNEFSYQKEYRLAFDNSNGDNNPLELDVGDLSDIASICAPEDINDLFEVVELEN